MRRSLASEITRLKAERDAVILAHNYQRMEVQEVADYLGDSLHLARLATEVPNPVIVFCGVRFMAETAKLLSPQKTVLHPVPGARCPMADMVGPEDVKLLRALYPDAAVVSYVNTNADVKAVSDVICTSANAVELVDRLGERRIIFLPDENLAAFVASRLPDREVIPGKGFCYVHADMSAEDVEASKKEHPEALVIVHPECPPEVSALADHVTSTSGMIKLAGELDAGEFIIGTEIGLVERLRVLYPDKRFYTLGPARICHNMKRITLEDVHNSLLRMQFPVEVDPSVAQDARAAILRMFEVTERDHRGD